MSSAYWQNDTYNSTEDENYEGVSAYNFGYRPTISNKIYGYVLNDSHSNMIPLQIAAEGLNQYTGITDGEKWAAPSSFVETFVKDRVIGVEAAGTEKNKPYYNGSIPAPTADDVFE